MSDVVLKVEGLYKRYRLGTVGAASFGEDLQRLWAKMRGKPDPFERYITSNELSAIKTPEEMKKLKARYVWALQDINFEVKQGEIVGIIGKNGSGKSTLLKILSKTTAPTKGQVKIKGRIASLLEVGTGFHGELTGRENIYLNGAILGMTRHEIRARLDEIIDFAGVEAYIDTPVKRYSSGMYVRLAFAVAAYLLADILIVDEVLAVGDGEFQKKCIGKMQDVSSGEGRTVLFVSHDMNVISTLTKNALLLRQGKIVKIGKTKETITEYLSDEKTKELTYKDEPSDDCPKVIYVQLFTSLPNNFHINGQQLSIKIILNTPFPVKNACISIQFYDSMGRNYVHIWNLSEVPFCYEKGNFELLAIIPKLRLYMGEYYLRIHLSEPQGGNKFQTIENICPFTVVMYEISRSFVWVANTCAYIEDCIWKVDKL